MANVRMIREPHGGPTALMRHGVGCFVVRRPCRHSGRCDRQRTGMMLGTESCSRGRHDNIAGTYRTRDPDDVRRAVHRTVNLAQVEHLRELVA